MTARKTHLLIGALLVAIAATPLLAQPTPTPVPGPTPSTTPPATGAAPALVYVPAAPAPAKPTGYFHYDDLITRPDDEPVVLHTGATPELHVVRRGDTLWDICWYYFNDPWQWPKVWSFNGQITNPHWIYPGDLVRLLPKGFLLVTPSTDPGLEPDAVPTPPAPPVVVPAGPIEARIKQVAFVDQDDLDSAMVITGAVEDKELLAEGDEVFVSYSQKEIPAIGSRFSVYTEEQAVTHPKTGGKLGAYVRILGDVEIVSVKKDKEARARIVASTGEIERGARVGPLQRRYQAIAPVPATVDVQGMIVARLVRTELIGSGEIVFVDLGESSGVVPGNQLSVVRRGDAMPSADPDSLIGQDDRRFPARELGTIVLIEVGKKLSVGLVDRSYEEMSVGDLVMARKQ